MARKRNQLVLHKQIIPKRGFATHKFVRYIRIPSRVTSQAGVPVTANWRLPPYGTQFNQNLYPMNTLFISTNDPMAVFNQQGTYVPSTPGWPLPNTRAFLNVPSTQPAQPPPTTSQALFDTEPLEGGDVPPETEIEIGYINKYPSFFRKMRQFYRRFTVVGTKCTVSFAPEIVQSLASQRVPNKHVIFTMGVRGSRGDLDTLSQPQDLTEQPGFITKEYNGVRSSVARTYAVSMTRKWSARKGFGLSKGDIVSNGEISGTSKAEPDFRLHGYESPNTSNVGNSNTVEFASHPHSQQYFAWSCNSLLTNNSVPGAYEPSQWPSGLIKVVIYYSTVWSSPEFTDNELGGY